jgi:phosphoribosylanthranilate isomerase
MCVTSTRVYKGVLVLYLLQSTFSHLPQQHAFSLVDAGTTLVKGGTGESVDWTKVKTLDGPVILAGGLNPGNVAEAIRISGAVRVEGPEGHKDPDLIKKFISEAKSVRF